MIKIRANNSNLLCQYYYSCLLYLISTTTTLNPVLLSLYYFLSLGFHCQASTAGLVSTWLSCPCKSDYAPAALKEIKKPENGLARSKKNGETLTSWLERCSFLPTAARGAWRALRSAGKELWGDEILFALFIKFLYRVWGMHIVRAYPFLCVCYLAARLFDDKIIFYLTWLSNAWDQPAALWKKSW